VVTSVQELCAIGSSGGDKPWDPSSSAEDDKSRGAPKPNAEGAPVGRLDFPKRHCKGWQQHLRAVVKP
jgi:hypothetical protein